MRIILFNDKENSDCSLGLINKDRESKGETKRYWKLQRFHSFIVQKLSKLITNRFSHLDLIRTYIYTGKYTPEMMNTFKRQCGKEINDMNELIAEEDKLLKDVNISNIDGKLKERIKTHVNNSKEIFKRFKETKRKAIEDHIRRRIGQEDAFKYYSYQKFFELRTTPLQARNSYIRQKGVDIKLATDIIQLGYTDAYDIALILTGDADLLESIKLIREKLGKIVILCSYYDEKDKIKSTISDSLISEADMFINLKLLSDSEVNSFSEVFEEKSRSDTILTKR